jgi:hypothetical protein
MAPTSTLTVPHWADVLALRAEVTSSDGSVGELQMSLHKAVYQTVDVPYREVGYYAEITEPAPHLIGFLGRIARRLGTSIRGWAAVRATLWSGSTTWLRSRTSSSVRI